MLMFIFYSLNYNVFMQYYRPAEYYNFIGLNILCNKASRTVPYTGRIAKIETEI